jgi:hypothetical protein
MSKILSIPFNYDSQTRRFLTQIINAFSGFQHQIIVDGKPELQRVPCTYAQQNKQVSTILKNNSDNVLLSVPMITVWLSSIDYKRDNTIAPSHVNQVEVYERKYDNGEYTSEPGNRYLVERISPMPFRAHIQVDIWTSNMEQKLQLFEQISTTYNGDFDIQSSDNPLEWTAKTRVMFESLEFTNTPVAIGNSTDLDVCSMKYYFDYYLSPPAKVKRLNIIERVIANINAGSSDNIIINDVGDDPWTNVENEELLFRIVDTPNDATVIVEGNKLILQDYMWEDITVNYGAIESGISKFSLFNDEDRKGSINIMGTVSTTSNPSVLLWNPDIDTLPQNTLKPIDNIVNPIKQRPGHELPIPQNGTRYLLTSEIGNSISWGLVATNGLFADYGDIIEYNNGLWIRVFRSSVEKDHHIVLCKSTNLQLAFIDHNWSSAINGKYPNKYWKLEV